MSSSFEPSQRTANKRKLASVLGVTTVTLGNWLERWPDFPVLERGTNGRDYVFDVRAVVDFLRAKKEAEAAAAAEKDEALSQLALPLLELEQPESAAGSRLSVKEQIAALELSTKRRKEAVELGKLVGADEVSETLMAAFANFSRGLRAAVRQAAADQNLPASVTRALEARIADAQRTFVRECRTYLVAEEFEEAMTDV